MANARIITLEEPDVFDQAVTFEEAFGEYSEVRGKGRARRKERKLERIANRREVKKARVAARDEVKSDRQDRRISRRERRKAGRQQVRTQQAEARQTRRTAKTEARQTRRAGRQAIRQERRGARTESRIGRRTMRRDFRDGRDRMDQGLDVETPEVINGVGFEPQTYTTPETNQTYTDETQGVYDQGGGIIDQRPLNYQPQPSTGGYDYGDEQSAPYREEDYYQPEPSGQGGYYDEEPQGNYEPTYNDQQGYYGDENNVEPQGEGVYNEDGDYVGEESGYLADYSYGDFDGKTVDVDPKIQSAVDKLAWNAECVKRLEKKRNLMPNKSQGISKRIIEHKKRFNELKSSLDDYSNAEGCDVGARKTMIKRAWTISQGKIKNAGRNKSMVVKPADDVVPVAADLNPSFSPNRIVVPNQMVSSVTGNTGLTGIDLQDDFDAPRVREVFIGADGSKSGISWGSVIIGAAIGVAAVWAVKKYKLLK